jgi:apolipoprotein N-acyltransferase
MISFLFKYIQLLFTSQQTWKRMLLVLVLGMIATTALPPVHIIFLLIPAFSGLLFLTQRAKGVWDAFWLGWWFGLGHFTTGLYWIAYALGVDLTSFAWLIPFTVLGLPAYFSIYSGAACALAYKFGRNASFKGAAQCLFFAALWSIFEILRGKVFTGFPWNLIGYSWVSVEGMLQVTAYTGIFGLSFITIFCSVLPVIVITNPASVRRTYKGTVLLLTYGALVLIWVLGTFRLSGASFQNVEGVYLRLVQPNISQKEKWDRQRSEDHLKTLLVLSQLPSKQPLTHIIWPESAAPFYFEQDVLRRLEVAAIAPRAGSVLLGGIRVTGTREDFKVWNGFMAIDAQGEVIATYDKSHLVPFGEYIPLRSVLPKNLKKITFGTVDFSEGTGITTLKVPGLPPFSPLICYEGIFPGEVTSKKDVRPEWLLNVTNDAWYGPTSGPYQHFSITRIRAIEEGIPIIRVANTGISGVTDAYGRVQAYLDLNQKGVLDVYLPKPSLKPTLYSQFGNNIVYVLLAFVIGFSFLLRRFEESQS